jgi:hypothetical protein
MYSSYFDFPRSAVLLVFFSSICSSSPSGQLGVIFPAQVSHKSYFGAQYSLLEIHFSVCATASSPPVHFSLWYFFFVIPCSVVHRFLSPLLHSSVGSLSVCCSVRRTMTHYSGLIPSLHIFFGFHRSAPGQRLLAPFPSWCLDSRLQFWLPGFFFSPAWISSASRAQCSHSFFRWKFLPPVQSLTAGGHHHFSITVFITVLIFHSSSCVWIVTGRRWYNSWVAGSKDLSFSSLNCSHITFSSLRTPAVQWNMHKA